MARFQQFWQKIAQANNVQSVACLDIGSATTKFAIGKQVLWHQPTVIAWHTDRHAVMAVGKKAYQLSGKTPRTVALISPIKEGVVADPLMMATYLESMLQQLRESNALQSLLNPACTVAVPAGASPVELHFFEQVIQQAGLTLAATVFKPAAIVKQRKAALDQTNGCIDLGAETVEVGFFTGDETIAMTTLRGLGANRWVRQVKETVAAQYGCDIGWQTAEKIVHSIGTVTRVTKDAPVMMVRGRDIQGSSAHTVKVSAESFVQPLQLALAEMTKEIVLFLESVPADVVTQALSNGIQLCGGGAQLGGIVDALKNELGGECVLSSTPELGVIKGLCV